MANDTAQDKASEPRDFFAALARDHVRIEDQLKALVRAAEAVGTAENDAAALAVISGTLEFFAGEGARHEAHEEQTLFPRLRSNPEFKQILSALEFQHRMNNTTFQELSACVAGFAPGSGRELRRQSIRFAEMHRGHAVAEERALFPLASARLTPQAIVEMTREMRKRNGQLGPDPTPGR
jgi:hemerythrin-like domain-containing protein